MNSAVTSAKETTMTRTRIVLPLLTLLALPGLLLFNAGCEDEPSSEGLDSYFDRNPFISDPRVTPSSLTIAPAESQVTTEGQTIDFVVAGGRGPFSWGVSKTSVGTVQPLGDDRHAIYTALDVADNNVIVADRDGQAAIGNINRPASSAFQIIPSTVTVTNQLAGDEIFFRAVGGVPPYGPWQVNAPELGTIDQNGVYTIQNPGTVISGENTISVTDSQDSVATATVIQQ
jgi:hypothetical protein